MSEKRYILALDEGTTSARAAVFDTVQNKFLAIVNKGFEQIYPKPGFVEHDPIAIYAAQMSALQEAVIMSKIKMSNVYGLGITNQRETVVVWDAITGVPIYNAIVWQCRRTADYCNKLIKDGLGDMIWSKTGLRIDAYFSASKIKWILDNVPEAKPLLKKKRLICGTIDTYLIWKLTNGEKHVTDVTNASRTMLFNIQKMDWDDELLNIFGVPREMMPQIVKNDEIVGNCELFGSKIPICGVAGDQQAALFGQCCFENGMAKNTYGTGGFILINTGSDLVLKNRNMLSTVAWNTKEGLNYALEGSIFNSGSTIKWLRDEMKMLVNASDCERYCNKVEDTMGAYLVPAFTGLGCPHWEMNARGVICGLTRGVTKYHVVRAGVEAMAYGVRDIFDDMKEKSGIKLTELKCDGGASVNNFLLQFQSDMLRVSIKRPKVTESTVLGVVYLCGLGVGAFSSMAEIASKWELDREFTANLPLNVANEKYLGWKRAVKCAKVWCEE